MKHPILISLVALSASTLPANAGDLVDVTPMAYDVVPPGAPFAFDYYAGATWGDVDGDGDPDLFVTDYYAGNRLYLNEPAPPGPGPARLLVLAEGAVDPDLDGAGEGAVFADFDNDGDPDLYVVNQGGAPNKLYENLGGVFADVTAGSGVGDPDFGEGCTVGDVDGDGLLDLFVTNYGDPADPFNPGAPNMLFLNAGGLSFVEATTELGLPMVPERSSACALVDYDLDGDVDLFVGNEAAPNHLFENLGGAFIEVTGSVGGPDLADADGGTFGARWFDGDNDGDLDLYVSNTATADSPDGVNKVFESGVAAGVKTLTLVTTGADTPAAGMAVSACDLDLDRDLDLALAAFGANEVFFGAPGLAFDPAPGYVPEPFADMSSSATSCDWDMDGDLDLFFGGLGTVFVYENLGDAGRGATVLTLLGDASAPYLVPADASGSSAWAKVASAGSPGLDPAPRMVVDPGSGYAQDARELHIGLALGTETVAEVDLHWADGTAETIFGLAAPGPGETRNDIAIEYPAGIATFGVQTDPTPLELWRGGSDSAFPAPALGTADFGLAARGFEPGSLPFGMYGLVEISLPIEGGDLLVLPIEFFGGTMDGDIARFPTPIPSSPALEGLPVLFQALAITPSAEIDWSNGLSVTLQP